MKIAAPKMKGIGMAAAKPAAVSRTPKPGTDAHYQAQNDMDTMRRYAEITMDPRRHASAKAVAAQHVKALSKVAK